MANTAFNHDPALTVAASNTTAGAAVKWVASKNLGESLIILDSGGNGRIGLAGDLDLITLTSGTVTVAGTVAATTLTGAGSGITALAAGNIGSGTVPTARLGSGTANNSVFLRGDGTWAAAGGGDLSFGGDTFGADKVIGSNDAYDLGFETSGTTRMTIDSGGKIGIGLTGPAKMLQLSSSSNSDKTAVVRVESTGSGGPGFQLFGPGDAAANARRFEIISMRENASDAAKLRISSVNDSGSDGASAIVAHIIEMTHAGEVTVKENTAMPSVTKGIAKAWVQVPADGSMTASSANSYNVASVTDQTTGDRTVVVDHDFSNTTYCALSSAGDYANLSLRTADYATGSWNFKVYDGSTLIDKKCASAAFGALG